MADGGDQGKILDTIIRQPLFAFHVHRKHGYGDMCIAASLSAFVFDVLFCRITIVVFIFTPRLDLRLLMFVCLLYHRCCLCFQVPPLPPLLPDSPFSLPLLIYLLLRLSSTPLSYKSCVREVAVRWFVIWVIFVTLKGTEEN
ncbi:hypothetical protein PIB30_036795 [Stylosanthes scabra]|uniref:Uncharacterized protein n=1 Tax=Stylosanthes scabra TaxID=79078 RepID=A0ABU6YFY3_9FABA|nr:hypothetical protein [Stylosanthes scabra]